MEQPLIEQKAVELMKAEGGRRSHEVQDLPDPLFAQLGRGHHAEVGGTGRLLLGLLRQRVVGEPSDLPFFDVDAGSLRGPASRSWGGMLCGAALEETTGFLQRTYKKAPGIGSRRAAEFMKISSKLLSPILFWGALIAWPSVRLDPSPGNRSDVSEGPWNRLPPAMPSRE